MNLTASEEAANMQKQVNEALLESLSDKRIVKVSIVNQDSGAASSLDVTKWNRG